MPPPPPGNVNNFLGITAGVAAGAAIADAVTTYPREVFTPRTDIGATPRIDRPAPPPGQRAGWNERAAGRTTQWQKRVDNRYESWNTWQQRNREVVTGFETTRSQRWNSLQSVQANRQDWRNQASPEWQKHRAQLWDYRAGRGREIWYKVRDYYDHVFDDRWWGTVGWAVRRPIPPYPQNPWWWWTWADWTAVSGYVESIPADPYYIDYGGQVIYDGDTVYVDNLAVPAAAYAQRAVELADNAALTEPPMPPEEGKPAEWLPLGVFALAQEEKGDPILIFQLSVNRAGVINGAYKSTIAEDQRPVTGQVDKATQRVAWRIGENRGTIFATSLANLTRDVSPIALHFGLSGTQTWLLIRMPEPGSATQAAKLPEISNTPPPLKTAKAQ